MTCSFNKAEHIISYALPDEYQKESFENFVESEVISCIPDNIGIISIDGLDGVGKSFLADEIYKSINCKIIHLDDFLIQDQNKYFSSIKYDDLENEISKNGVKIVEGCIVENILEKLKITPDFRIYIIRTTQMRYQSEHEWIEDREVFCEDKSWQEKIEIEEEQFRAFLKFESGDNSKEEKAELSGLRKELLQYHSEKRPHDSADLVVKLVRYS